MKRIKTLQRMIVQISKPTASFIIEEWAEV